MDAEKLARLQKQVRIGGKGTPRRKVKRVAKSSGDDTKLQAALQKVNASTLPGIDQVNMLRDDGKVLHFPRARVQGASNANTYAIHGTPQEKEMTEFLPEVLSSMTPENMEQLRVLTESMRAGGAGAAGDAATGAEEEIPELVEGENFEVD